MSCDCPGAPHLSGAAARNEQKESTEVKTYAVPWCAELGDDPDAQIIASQWAISPTSTVTPLLVDSDTIDATVTHVTVSGGKSCTLYFLINTVTIDLGDSTPFQTLVYEIQVWVPRG